MCIEKGSNLTLNQAIEISTLCKVSYMSPEFGSNTSQAAVNKIHGKVRGAKS